MAQSPDYTATQRPATLTGIVRLRTTPRAHGPVPSEGRGWHVRQGSPWQRSRELTRTLRLARSGT